MAQLTLQLPNQMQSRAYPLDRRLTCTTIIEDSPQDTPQNAMWSARRSRWLQSAMAKSPLSTGGRTPTASRFDLGKITEQSGEFDDLYDVTDNEDSEEIPIQFGSPLASMEEMKVTRPRYPSIVIPSPGHWPTIEKLRKQEASPLTMLSPGLLSPVSIKSPSVHSLAKMAARNAQPMAMNVPSLDGSLTSEELSTLSCPSTPDLEAAAVREEDWTAPVTLHSNALETLRSLTGGSDAAEPRYIAIPVAEMREVGEDAQQIPDEMLFTPVDDDDGQLSFLSIPSPGGFFSTLEPGSRNAWLQSPQDQLTTSIAERFYGLPWDQRGSNATLSRQGQSKPPSPRRFEAPSQSAPILEQSLYIADEEALTEGPPTARRIPIVSPRHPVNVQTPKTLTGAGLKTATQATFDLEAIDAAFEYKEKYADEIQVTGKVNFDRTSFWLSQQDSYLSQLEDDLYVDPSVSDYNAEAAAPVQDGSLETIPEEPIEESEPEKPTPACPQKELPPLPADQDTTHVDGFRFLSQTAKAADAFVQRKTRTDALRLDRQCLFSSHLEQVEGKFEVTEAPQTSVHRPFSGLSVIEESSEEKEYVDSAQRERKVLEQIKPVSWNLEATKYLNGGSLLMSPTGRTFERKRNCRVLDLGGQATCDWAWQVAIEHPNTTVHTVYTDDQSAPMGKIQGPTNHKSSRVASLCTLPFPDNHFHLVSARNLYAILRSSATRTADEYDMCLKECLRVLKPGGCLEFSLLDADIVGAGPQAASVSAEFNYSLRSCGYDPAPTKSWLPRLRRAGFGEVRRAWLVLPMAQQTLDHDVPNSSEDGSTRDASFISGMVGSWAWEKWMAKVQREMGCPEERLLDGVAGALEEGARTPGASWRYLSGYARKSKM